MASTVPAAWYDSVAASSPTRVMPVLVRSVTPPLERASTFTSIYLDSSLIRPSWAFWAPVTSSFVTVPAAMVLFSLAICSSSGLTVSTALSNRPSAS